MNTRWLALVLMMALIPGCSGKAIETAPSEALYEAKPGPTVGFASFYDVPETGGAMEAAALNIPDVTGFYLWQDDILLFSGSEVTTLTLIDRHTHMVKAETGLCVDDSCLTMSPTTITYVDTVSRELVFLNTALEEFRRLPLPEGATHPIVSPVQQSLYYCTADAVRVLDLNAGTDRPVREMSYHRQEITALHCDDTVLQCRVFHEDGSSSTLFISAEDGRCLFESADDVPVWTDGDLYFCLRMDGTYREYLSGSSAFGPSVLVTETEPIDLTPVLDQKLVLIHTRSADGGTVLDGYHLENGRRITRITLPGNYEIIDIQSDPAWDSLWILCQDRHTGTAMLCVWELGCSDPQDSSNYLQPRWDREHPDWEGLSQCEAFAVQLSQKYGVQIRLPSDTAEFSIGDYRFLPEYQVPTIRQMLQQLDIALSRYPSGFLQELAIPTDSGQLTICPVRSICSADSPDELYPNLLHRDAHGNVYLVVTPGPEPVRLIDRMLCDLIDSRVLSICDAYDSWDRRSTSGSGHPERVRILEEAMQEDGAAYFFSGYMQSALRQLCLGIRETFRTADSAEQLPWEQHLLGNP